MQRLIEGKGMEGAAQKDKKKDKDRPSKKAKR